MPSIRTTTFVCLRPSEISALSLLAIVSPEASVSRLRPDNVCAEDLALLGGIWPQILLREEHVESF